MLRRSKPSAPAETPEETLERLGKGRPTPTRKEAEALAKARAKAAKDPKQARAMARQRRTSTSREIREGIKRGDERYLGKRDKGPVRRFVRDFVDARLNIAEFALPLMFASLLFSAAGQLVVGNGILNATILVTIMDCIWLRWRLMREVKRRFPGESTRGLTLYALTRALQLRFMRLPKPNVRIGQQLPEHYR